jgi:hypothetical protein
MADMLTPNRTAKRGDSRGFQRMFAPDRLTLGVLFPIEAFSGDQPTMRGQERLARRAEELGYAALWCRDGRHFVPRFIGAVRSIGVNHVILNFKYGAQRQRRARRDRQGDPAAAGGIPALSRTAGRVGVARTAKWIGAEKAASRNCSAVAGRPNR